MRAKQGRHSGPRPFSRTPQPRSGPWRETSRGSRPPSQLSPTPCQLPAGSGPSRIHPGARRERRGLSQWCGPSWAGQEGPRSGWDDRAPLAPWRRGWRMPEAGDDAHLGREAPASDAGRETLVTPGCARRKGQLEPRRGPRDARGQEGTHAPLAGGGPGDAEGAPAPGGPPLTPRAPCRGGGARARCARRRAAARGGRRAGRSGRRPAGPTPAP